MHFSRSYDVRGVFLFTVTFADALEFAVCAVPEVHRPVSAREEEDLTRGGGGHSASEFRSTEMSLVTRTCLDA